MTDLVLFVRKDLQVLKSSGRDYGLLIALLEQPPKVFDGDGQVSRVDIVKWVVFICPIRLDIVHQELDVRRNPAKAPLVELLHELFSSD